jgi:hypothetical protein
MLEQIPVTINQMGQGTVSTLAEVRALKRAWRGCPRGIASAIAVRSSDSSGTEIVPTFFFDNASLHQKTQKYFFTLPDFALLLPQDHAR